jgi:hypothetical protein
VEQRREKGVHATVSFTAVATSDLTLLALRALFAFGWEFHYGGGPEGATLEVPGVRTFKLRQSSGIAHVHLILVKLPASSEHPAGVAIYDSKIPSHRGLRQYQLMVDSGAESSLISHTDRDILVRTGE